MKSARSKLLHEVAGHSLLSYAVSAATNLQPEHIVVVVGHGRDQVEAHLNEIAPHVTTAVQEQQLGTGHAVQVALHRSVALSGEVVVTYGDVPMLATETLAALLEEHRRQQAAVTVLTAEVPDPTGYGRILRDADGAVRGIVEHRDADDAQRAIHEINSGIYVFDGRDPAVGADRAERRQRPGRAVPDRRAGAGPARGRAVAALVDRRPVADRGRQRPGPAGRHQRRDEPADPAPLDAGRGDRRRPGHHLGARLGGSGAATSPCCRGPRWRGPPRSPPARPSARTPP